MNPNVSFFPNLRANGEQVPILELLELIRAGKWAKQIEKLRGEPEKERAKKLKRALPGFTASCVTNGGHKGDAVVAHSGLLQGDVDKLGAEGAEALRESLRGDPCVFAAWISPSGTGAKFLLRIPGDVENHGAAFSAAEKHFREKWGVSIDSRCRDISRLCFVSFDSGLWVNESASVLPVELVRVYELGRGENEQLAQKHSSVSVSESKSMQQEHRFASPVVAQLFHTLVRSRAGSVYPGTRNGHLCEIVPFLFFAVSKGMALHFAEEFHKENVAVFKDPIADTLKQSADLLRGVEESYLGTLPPATRAKYEPLAEVEKAAFRICRSLSQLETEEMPAGQFFISCASLAARLGIVNSMPAHRLLADFRAKGILAIMKKGFPWLKGQKDERGTATVWRWLLE